MRYKEDVWSKTEIATAARNWTHGTREPGSGDTFNRKVMICCFNEWTKVSKRKEKTVKAIFFFPNDSIWPKSSIFPMKAIKRLSPSGKCFGKGQKQPKEKSVKIWVSLIKFHASTIQTNASVLVLLLRQKLWWKKSTTSCPSRSLQFRRIFATLEAGQRLLHLHSERESESWLAWLLQVLCYAWWSFQSPLLGVVV